MVDLSPLTALGGTAPMTRKVGALTLIERPDIALVSLARPRGQVAPVLPGLSLPGPGRYASGPDLATFWSAPGQWMVEGSSQAETDFAAHVRALAPGTCVTDQTDAWAAIDIQGDGMSLRHFLGRTVNLPPRATAVGHATRSVLHHMPVFLVRRSEDHLTLWGMRSSAGSLWHAVETASLRC
ncbi:Sarcosine oxidase gamma subunit [Rhodovulum sp. P5]|uniref:sarcosine oxidase subunit gamma n=1 Tax=Rhodovulum sp. P5 TaxID=1564506 RepID=UPI0009C2F357|nr:sarcosine oxidase subunit gamma [Rhodovulum sp. P5]ARE41346.1 Sarcosine oxidase gamma subunit [Rhodovulum sp. P5]